MTNAVGTTLTGVQAVLKVDDGPAKSTNAYDAGRDVVSLVLLKLIAEARSQRLPGADREEKFASAKTIDAVGRRGEVEATVLPSPSAKTAEIPEKPTSKLAVAPAQKRIIGHPSRSPR